MSQFFRLEVRQGSLWVKSRCWQCYIPSWRLWGKNLLSGSFRCWLNSSFFVFCGCKTESLPCLAFSKWLVFAPRSCLFFSCLLWASRGLSLVLTCGPLYQSQQPRTPLIPWISRISSSVMSFLYFPLLASDNSVLSKVHVIWSSPLR